MAMTWGSKPIMENVGTIEQVVVNEATSFSTTQIFAANTHGDIFEFQHAKPDMPTKIFVGNGTVASTLAHDDTHLFSVLNGTVFTDTSGLYIYQFVGGAIPGNRLR